MLHPQMRVRLTTQVLPPWAVQDASGIIMEIDLSARDRQRIKNSGDSHLAAEMVLEELPHGVYVKLDECNRDASRQMFQACEESERGEIEELGEWLIHLY